MDNKQMMAAIGALPTPDLLEAGGLNDPIGENEYYSARTVVQLLAVERARCVGLCEEMIKGADARDDLITADALRMLATQIRGG